jgi:hypothetical protein
MDMDEILIWGLDLYVAVNNYVDTPILIHIPTDSIQSIPVPGTRMLVAKLLIRPEFG